MSKEIPLTQGQVAIVCDCHYHLVKNHKWCAQWKRIRNCFYAVRNASAAERLVGAPTTILMHAVINSTANGMHTDHRDRDTLNNRCSNLRTATASENHHNQDKHKNNTTGFKGVSWIKLHRKWRARIMLNGKTISLGLFDSSQDAAHAYDDAALKLLGEFAKTNF